MGLIIPLLKPNIQSTVTDLKANLIGCLEPTNSSILYDLHGNNDATIYGASYTSSILSLDGNNDYCRLTSVINESSTKSVSIWFRTSTKPGGLLGSTSSYGVPGGALSGNYTPLLWIEPTTGYCTAGIYSSGQKRIRYATDVADGEWHLAVINWGTSQFELYVDNILVNSLGYTRSTSVEDYNFIGVSSGRSWSYHTSSYWYFLNGDISQLAIFSSVSSAARVSDLWNNSNILTYSEW